MLMLALCVLLLAGCSKPVEAAAPQEPVRVEPLVVVVGTPPELQVVDTLALIDSDRNGSVDQSVSLTPQTWGAMGLNQWQNWED